MDISALTAISQQISKKTSESSSSVDPDQVARFNEIFSSLSPEQAALSQKELSKTIVTTDFEAKVAGFLSQAVNKLVNMQ